MSSMATTLISAAVTKYVMPSSGVSWTHEAMKCVMDAATSLKAAIAVIITTTGSGFGVIFELIDKGLGLLGVACGVTLSIFLIRKTALELEIMRKKEKERLEDRLKRVQPGVADRRADDG